MRIQIAELPRHRQSSCVLLNEDEPSVEAAPAGGAGRPVALIACADADRTWGAATSRLREYDELSASVGDRDAVLGQVETDLSAVGLRVEGEDSVAVGHLLPAGAVLAPELGEGG